MNMRHSRVGKHDVSILSQVFWVVTPCSGVVVYHRFRASCFLHPATSSWKCRQHGPLKRCYPTTTLDSVTTQKTATRNIAAVEVSQFVLNSLLMLWSLRHWRPGMFVCRRRMNQIWMKSVMNSEIIPKTRLHRQSLYMKVYIHDCILKVSINMWEEYFVLLTFFHKMFLFRYGHQEVQWSS
jgi:hypothetical protein